MQVVSSMLQEVSYRYRILTVTFNNGSKYTYHKVPRAIYNELVVAPSKGQYFNQHIKWQFGYKKLS